MRLLSPQHFAKNCENEEVIADNTKATQYHNRNVLTWGKIGEFKKTVYNSRTSNVLMFYSSPSTSKFLSFASKTADPEEHKDKFAIYASKESEDNTTVTNRKENDSQIREDEIILIF